MGCHVCRGPAGRVCSAPGCRDESAEIEAAMRREDARPKPPVLACGRCGCRLLPVSDGSWICLDHGVQVPRGA